MRRFVFTMGNEDFLFQLPCLHLLTVPNLVIVHHLPADGTGNIDDKLLHQRQDLDTRLFGGDLEVQHGLRNRLKFNLVQFEVVVNISNLHVAGCFFILEKTGKLKASQLGSKMHRILLRSLREKIDTIKDHKIAIYGIGRFLFHISYTRF